MSIFDPKYYDQIGQYEQDSLNKILKEYIRRNRMKRCNNPNHKSYNSPISECNETECIIQMIHDD